MKSFDFSKLTQRRIYELMIESIVPRPIALISTQNAQGQTNLAPFSFFNGVSSAPPCISVAITTRRPQPKPEASAQNKLTKPEASLHKDTLRNILQTRQFVVNSANHWFLTQMNQCAAEFPYGVSEFDMTGLNPVASTKVAPPRVKEAAWAMECELVQTVEIGSSTLVIGKILLMHLQEKILSSNEKIDIAALDPVSRLGGQLYGRTRDVIELSRPQAVKL